MTNTSKNEKTIFEIFNIIYRRKLYIILSIIIAVIIGYIYAKSSEPIYESKALLKKESSDKKSSSNDFYEMVKLQTQDEIETELQLVKTSEVLGSVIKQLGLCFNLTEAISPEGRAVLLKNVFIDFPNEGNNYYKILKFPLPEISSLEIFSQNVDNKNFYIVKKGEKLFELHDAVNNSLIVSAQNNINDSVSSDSLVNLKSGSKFQTDWFSFNIAWDNAPIGSKIFFNIKDYQVMNDLLSNKINVSKIGKTNVFSISFRSTSPFAAKTIVTSVVDNYREARIDQQKQTIKYSFKFVDEQLGEIKTKLSEAENNLSNFKSSGKIISVDESSKELVKYLSSLEAEKLNTDLQLSDYKNKAEELKDEIKTSGYFDQSFLESKNENANSPFSSLLKQLSDLELQRLELLQKKSENHPDVKNLDEQIKSAKEKLASYNENSLTSYQIIINSLEKKLSKINNLMSGYEVQLQKLPGQESQLARLLRQKDVYEKMFTLLLDKREEMRIAELSKLQDIVIVDLAKVPSDPVAPNKKLILMVAFILGGFVGLMGIFIIELKNSKLINIDDLERDIQLPIIALLPKYPRDVLKRMKQSTENRDKFVTLMENHSGIKESFRVLKTKLLLQADRTDKILLVTSCEENTGKTTIVSNLAITFAQENKKVLIIDCDLRKAELTKLFNISLDTPGVVDYLETDVPPSIYTKLMNKIDIIPAGGIREDSAALLSSENMQLLVDSLQYSDYDYILIDTPPVTRVVDTLVLGKIIKNVVVVVRPLVSFKVAVAAGIQELKQSKLKIRGIIANAVEINKSYAYRYKYGYGYGYQNGKANKLKILNFTKRKNGLKKLDKEKYNIS